METLDEDARYLSYEDRRVLDLWDREIEHNDGHYVIPIPWKEDSATMPNNKYAATSRLNNLNNRLPMTDMLEQYSGQLKKMEMDGYAEKVEVCLNNQCLQGPELNN